jgi:hypothetical protein
MVNCNPSNARAIEWQQQVFRNLGSPLHSCFYEYLDKRGPMLAYRYILTPKGSLDTYYGTIPYVGLFHRYLFYVTIIKG